VEVVEAVVDMKAVVDMEAVMEYVEEDT